MTQTIITCLLLSLTTSLLFATSPIVLGLTCLTMAFFAAALLTSLFSSWFGLIALLIYVGGLLVMFAYFLAICPNQLISLKTPAIMFTLTALITLSMMSLIDPETPTSSEPTHFSLMFLPSHASLFILLALLLLLTMIVVVKVTQRRRGPLRPFN